MRQMNSGRDIIDNLLELSDNAKKNLDGADVPKCPGHGYPCVKKIVKKSGKNRIFNLRRWATMSLLPFMKNLPKHLRSVIK